MKQLLKNSRARLLICAPFILFLGLRIISSYIFTIKRHAFTFDTYIAPEMCKTLQDFVINHAPLHAKLPDDICEHLCKEFPYIEKAEVHFIAPGVMCTDIRAQQPILAVNKTHVVVQSGALLPINLFYMYRTQFLPRVEVNNLASQNGYQIAFLTRAAPQLSLLCKRYYIQWQDECTILLRDKAQENFSIVCSADTLPNDHVLACCAMIEDEYKNAQQGTGRKAAPKALIADVRFDKQIIVSSTQGGTAHG